MSVDYQEYFKYYMELERDFFSIEPYVTIDVDNFNTFSVQYNRIYQSICSEIDSMLKQLCRQIDLQYEANNIGVYCKLIQKHFTFFNLETVYLYKSRIELQPWKEWNESKPPVWWTMYNKVKHHRMEIYKTTDKPFYKQANLENVLNALAALYIVEQYYIYSFNFSKDIEITEIMRNNPHMIEESINRKREIAFLFSKSQNCYMKRWQDAGCYSSFMGQNFFDYKKLEKIML